LEALESCLEALPTNHHQLLKERYAPRGSVEKIAASRNKTPTAISCLLYRIRTVLVECIKRKLERAVL
jgi:RNA polymerase sigma-70 factor (ECF subfamily)